MASYKPRIVVGATKTPVAVLQLETANKPLLLGRGLIPCPQVESLWFQVSAGDPDVKITGRADNGSCNGITAGSVCEHLQKLADAGVLGTVKLMFSRAENAAFWRRRLNLREPPMERNKKGELVITRGARTASMPLATLVANQREIAETYKREGMPNF